MKTLLRQDIPEDFVYYRTGSEVFYEYSREFYWWDIVDVADKHPQFMRIERWLGGLWNTVDAEKIDTEPDIHALRRSWYNHGIVFWSPLRRREKPKWWFKLPRYFAPKLLHASRSAFSILDTPEHWTKWSSEARNHRKKFLKNVENGNVHIESSEDIELFYQSYKSATISDPNKRIHIQWLERMIATEGMRNKRIYLWYIWDTLVAGALFIDMGTTSEYFMSFYPPESRAYQFGIGIIDRWMTDSYALRIRYCDLDHMWERGYPSSQKWYTEFKSGIVEYDVYFHDVWVRFF